MCAIIDPGQRSNMAGILSKLGLLFYKKLAACVEVIFNRCVQLVASAS